MDEQLLHKAIHMVDNVMLHVTMDDMEKPTPCQHWDVHMLINHIVAEVAWIEPLCHGKTIAEMGKAFEGDLLQGKPYDAWRTNAVNAINTAHTVDPKITVHLSYGAKAAQDYLDEVAGNLIIHGWDLAKGVGAKYHIDDSTVKQVMDATKDTMPVSRKSGKIAEALAFTSDALPSEVLLATFGRDINWHA